MRIVAVTTVASPYILARYRRFAELNPAHELTLVEYGRVSSEYAWAPSHEEAPFRRFVLSERPIHSYNSFSRSRLIKDALREIQPDVLVVCGYGVTGMGAALQWACRHNRDVRVVMLSDSTADYQPRSGWKEYLKRRVIAQCGSALVAGSRHKAYMLQLGMRDERIFDGYDVVDNSYFERQSDQMRDGARNPSLHGDLPRQFFLGNARFLTNDSGVFDRKNLHRLIEAYHGYLHRSPPSPWGLVLLGDGALRPAIESQVRRLGLSGDVRLVGFKQYDELPTYYARASAFILASVRETWGLVVNEAMASGLPIIVSTHCGCATDLVIEGENGFTFDPFDVIALTNVMLKIGSNECDRIAMGRKSREIISRWSLDLFAENLGKAVNAACGPSRPRPDIFDKALLGMLMWR